MKRSKYSQLRTKLIKAREIISRRNLLSIQKVKNKFALNNYDCLRKILTQYHQENFSQLPDQMKILP